MKIRRSLAVGVGAALLAPLVLPGAASSADADPVVVSARAWLLTQQQEDGGFEVAGFGGFETPDAIAALAGAAQSGPTWSEAEALAAVEAATVEGLDALDAMDDQVDGEAAPESQGASTRATKAIALVAVPLGLDPSDFDPSGDSEAPVDLVGRMNAQRQEDGSYDFGSFFNGLLFAAIALDSLGEPVAPAHVAQIKAGQRADGSWDYTGTPTEGPGSDIDTTAAALIALSSAGLDRTDAAVAAGIAYLQSNRQANGSWQSFGSSDPNATSMAAIALSDLHVDVAPNATSNPYAWLRSQQNADGHINSPNDAFGPVNTFATGQSIEALSRQLFLGDEREALLTHLSRTVASPADAPAVDRALPEGSDALGPNPSIKSARTSAASTMVMSDAGRRAAVEDLFQAAFGRSVDPSGATYWSSKLSTLSRPEVLSRLTGSSEYYRTAGGTIPTFVDAVYQSVLGRGSDPSGRAYWIRQLENGRSVQAVARSLVASPEYRRNQVNATFERILDRAPTAGELNYWTTKIAKTRIEVLIQTLGGSIELYDQVGTVS